MINTKRNWYRIAKYKDIKWIKNYIKSKTRVNIKKFRRSNKLGLEFNIIGSPSIWYM